MGLVFELFELGLQTPLMLELIFKSKTLTFFDGSSDTNHGLEYEQECLQGVHCSRNWRTLGSARCFKPFAWTMNRVTLDAAVIYIWLPHNHLLAILTL